MSADATPLIVEQPRAAPDIAARLEARLLASGFAPAAGDALRSALVHIAARYGEILTEQLNAAPHRHGEAFLSRLLGAPTPAAPAQVLLSFTPVPGPAPGPRRAAQAPIVVPAFTSVAAPPVKGESEPVVFQTGTDLTLLRATIARALAVDPLRLVVADVGGLASVPGLAASDLFAAARPFVPAVHLAAPEVLGAAGLDTVLIEVEVQFGGVRPPGAHIEWGIDTKDGFVPLEPRSDTTRQLRESGVVELAAPAQWPSHAIVGIASTWLGCRMLHDGSAALPVDTPFAAPRVGRLLLRSKVRIEDAALEAVQYGAIPLDASKDFYPLGERPRFGDVFYLASPAFAQPGARVTLALRMTNPAGRSDGPLPPVRREGQPRLVWEIHTRRGWVVAGADDGTQSLTQDGQVGFGVPADVAPLVLGGKEAAWLRARLAAGHYGLPAVVDGVTYTTAPSIAGLRVRSSAELGPKEPLAVVQDGLLDARLVAPHAIAGMPLFAGPELLGPALLFGLDSQEQTWRDRVLSLQVEPAPPVGRVVLRDSARAGRDAPDWQLLGVDGWRGCVLEQDETSGLRRAGLLRLRLPDTLAMWPGLVWLRAVWPPAGEMPALRRIALNAVRAAQTVKLDNEILGSGHGRAGQEFRALRTPIIGDVALEVRELAAGGTELWVRWHPVADFEASGPGDRHFMLDRSSGRVVFGDGRHGRIPPQGASNIRLHRYHAGGGRRGNQPARTIAQLRTTVPYVESVTNLEPAGGGQDSPDGAARQRAAGAWLRHRDRAVCADDYADLARAAAPEVARAYCHGGRDLAAERAVAAGVVSVVVVPQGSEPRPQPTLELLGRVKACLDARRPWFAELVVLGPDYVGVSVRANVRLAPGWAASETAGACRERIAQYLHPVSGGPAGEGWAPGERPHRSDLVALLGAVDGVDYVETLAIQVDPAGIDGGLVCSGTLEVSA